jgi:hypothetical protein
MTISLGKARVAGSPRLEAEVDEYLASFVDEVGGLGRRPAVCNGHARATRHGRLRDRANQCARA